MGQKHQPSSPRSPWRNVAAVACALAIFLWPTGDEAAAAAALRQQQQESAELSVALAQQEASRDAARASRDLARIEGEESAPALISAAAPRPPAPQKAAVYEPGGAGYRGYTFWSSDFHISPIADLKDLFKPLGMKIIDESLSGHCHLKKTCSRNLKVLTKGNGIDLGRCPNQLRRQFFEAYKNDGRMRGVDAFLCHHAAGLCEVYMPFNASLVVVVSTRYEIGRHDPKRWRAWNANLKAMARNPRNVIAANNRYDAEYLKYFTGLKDVPVLPNYCGYTGATYTPSRPQVLVGPGRGVNPDLFGRLQRAAQRGRRCENDPKRKALCKDGKLDFRRIRDLYPHFEYSDLAAHPAVVLVPYQVSVMSIFEYYRMGLPMWAPAPALLAKWQLSHRVMSERTWDLVRHKGRPSKGSPLPQAPGGAYPSDPNDEFDAEAIAFWIKFADFYQWPHIRTFSSVDDLVAQLTDPSLDLAQMSRDVKAYNERMVLDLKNEWKALFERMFHGLPPAQKQKRRQIQDYDAALLAAYGARQSDRCVGDRHGLGGVERW